MTREGFHGIRRERAFFHWLYNIEGIGRITIRKLLKEAESAERVFALEEERLKRILTPGQLGKFRKAKERAEVLQEYGALREKGIDLYPASDPMYPKRLLEIPDRPEAIYVIGRLPEERRPAVALIGARVCSGYGAYAAEWFGGELARAGVCVISGLARGIDGIGQKAALECGGSTCAVLGCGPDICYPPENGRIYDGIRRHGAIISEYPPGTAPKAGLFPQRNRIISGLADLVLVIEAREKSGTLITVDTALEQGKEVWAVPGRLTDSLSDGCNRLIWQGAVPALSPASVLEALRQLPYPENAAAWQEQKGKAGERPAEDGIRRSVLSVLDFFPKTPAQISEELKGKGCFCGLPELMELLMDLTLEEKCVQEGNRFARKF